MALNRYYQNHHPFFQGFDDFFTPPSFARDPVFDLMPVIPSLLRDDDMQLMRTSPGYEINESDNMYSIAVDVPGVKAQDMKVELEHEGRVLHISGGRKVEQDNGTTRETKFEKRFTIGENVDKDKMTANLENGVLVLTAPKIEKQQIPVRQIAITEGGSK